MEWVISFSSIVVLTIKKKKSLYKWTCTVHTGVNDSTFKKKLELLYNAALVSAVQQCESAHFILV